MLGDLAFEWQRGWKWPCFDTDLSAFVMKTHLVSIRTTWFTWQKQWGLYQNKVTSSLAAIQRPGQRAGNCKIKWSIAFDTAEIRRMNVVLALSHIHLFQERLLYKSVKAYATKAKGILGNSGQRLLDWSWRKESKEHRHVYLCFSFLKLCWLNQGIPNYHYP